jgi:hypothetical protein
VAFTESIARSLAAYLEICAQLVRKWSTPASGELGLWYRGQSKAQRGLIPGEYRYTLLNPDEMRSEFILKAKPLLDKEPSTDWEWYFLMQHYGLPTRLLDWTEGSLIGLHFALSKDTGKEDAAVWALDPWMLNKWSIKKSDLVITGGQFEPDPIAKKYLGRVYQKLKLPSHPIAIVPPYNSPRITAQRGTFTVHGFCTKGIEKQFSKRLVKITIPKDSALEMRRQLRTAGISEFTLFPDLDGLCRDIRAVEVEGC